MARTTLRPLARAATLGTTMNAGNTEWPTSSTAWPASSTSTAGAAVSSTPGGVTSAPSALSALLTTLMPTQKDLASSPLMDAMTTSAVTAGPDGLFGDLDLQSDSKNNIPRLLESVNASAANITSAAIMGVNSLWNPRLNAYAEALSSGDHHYLQGSSCGRINIMGTIVKDAAPYLFPFIIEYSLIGAAVIYVMWKHIGRHPRWPNQAEADLERRLEAMLSRRAVALANAGAYIPVFGLC